MSTNRLIVYFRKLHCLPSREKKKVKLHKLTVALPSECLQVFWMLHWQREMRIEPKDKEEKRDWNIWNSFQTHIYNKRQVAGKTLCVQKHSHSLVSALSPHTALPGAEDLPLAQFAAMPSFLLPCARLQTDIVPKCQGRTHLLAFNSKIRFKHFSKTDVLIHLVIELDTIPPSWHTNSQITLQPWPFAVLKNLWMLNLRLSPATHSWQTFSHRQWENNFRIVVRYLSWDTYSNHLPLKHPRNLTFLIQQLLD